MENIYMLSDAEITNKISAKIKELRLKQNISRKDMAASSGVSVASGIIMKKFINILFLLVVLISSIPCFAQRVEYDFNKDGLRYIFTASTPVLTPNDSHFPISISINYYGNENVRQYFLRLYGRYELTKDTKLALTLADGSEMQFEAYASNIYHDRLGLIKKKTIYDALYIITNEQLSNILNSTIVGVKIKTGDDWHCKTFKHNKIGELLKLNYRVINKRLNKR